MIFLPYSVTIIYVEELMELNHAIYLPEPSLRVKPITHT